MYEEKIAEKVLERKSIIMKKVLFATGSRADYGIVRRYLQLLNDDVRVDLKILVTGALLDEKFGHQVNLIYNDGFDIAAEIKTTIDSSSNKKIIDNMAETLSKFGEYFSKDSIDLLIILGDRYEMLSVAIAASMQRIPILHIHGGESTFGNYDEFIRHSITKMSLYHFTATNEYRKRVIQLGEDPNRVFYLGALGAENCKFIEEINVPAYIKELPYKKYFIVLFHPETLTNVDILDQTNALLDAIDYYKDYKFVFLGTNADTNSNIIRNRVSEYINTHSNALYYENLHTDAYHYLLQHGICLIGNSSSGIIEAPSLNIFTVNIGERQAGRVKGNSVISVPWEKDAIIKAINEVLQNHSNVRPINPYFKENSAQLYYEKTLNLLERIEADTCEPKKFYDLP